MLRWLRRKWPLSSSRRQKSRPKPPNVAEKSRPKKPNVAEIICRRLRENDPTLTWVYLNDKKIGDDGATAIAEALKDNTVLQTLFLGNNQIHDSGAKALAAALKYNTALQELNLGKNQIGDDGANAIAEAMKDNRVLQKLWLHNNQIRDSGAKALAVALKYNTALQELNLGKNQIGDAGAKAIADALKDNTALQTLGFGSNQIGDDGAEAIAEALMYNTDLRVLWLGNNEIGNDGAHALLDAVKFHNGSLTHASLAFYLMDGIKSLVESNKNGTRNPPPRPLMRPVTKPSQQENNSEESMSEPQPQLVSDAATVPQEEAPVTHDETKEKTRPKSMNELQPQVRTDATDALLKERLGHLEELMAGKQAALLKLLNQAAIKYNQNDVKTGFEILFKNPQVLDLICLREIDSEADMVEKMAILECQQHRDFYLHFIQKFRGMVTACDSLSNNMVASGGKSFRSFACQLLQDNACEIAASTPVGEIVGAAIHRASKQIPIPFADALGSFCKILFTLYSERERQLAVARIAHFTTLADVSVEGSLSDGVKQTIEKMARLLVRARSSLPREECPHKEAGHEFGKIKCFIIKLLADPADTPSGVQGCRAADALLAHIMQPNANTTLELILSPSESNNPGQGGASQECFGNLDMTLVAAALEKPVDEVEKVLSQRFTPGTDQPPTSSETTGQEFVSKEVTDTLHRRLKELEKQHAAMRNINSEKDLNAGGGLVYSYKDFREQYKGRVEIVETEMRVIGEQLPVHAQRLAEHGEELAEHRQEQLVALELENEKLRRKKRW